jgi:hypothetical protein
MRTRKLLAARWLVSLLAFPLLSDQGEAGGAALVGGVPSNDDCVNATPIALTGPLSSAPGSTEFATADAVPACNTTVVNPGVWFSVVGNGNTLTADSCVEPGFTGHFVSVFCGDCSDLHCVGANVDGFCAAPSNVEWCSRAGARYLILVHPPAAGGGFNVIITDFGQPCASTDPCLDTGACCTGPVLETCVEVTAADCVALGGSYQGDGTTCAGVTCGPAPFCDGSDNALASCPCGNAGAPDSGCDIAQGTGGVKLFVTEQETSPSNRVTFLGAGFPATDTPTAVVIRAPALDAATPVIFGDGLRCVGTPVVRLGATLAVGGVSNHTFGHGSMAGLGDFYYQLWFRNTPITFCDATAAFSLSSGRQITW